MSVIRIRSEEELYNRFDPAQTRLSSDAYSYLKSLYSEMSVEERRDDILKIECPGPVDIQKAENAIHASIGRDIAEYDRQLKINKVKMVRLYVIGIALIVVGFVLAVTLDKLILEVISIVGSMAVKDASTIQIQNNPEIRLKKKLLEKVMNLRVELVSGAGS